MRKENVYWGKDLGESIQDRRDAQQELDGPIDAVKSIADRRVGNVF